MKKKHLIGFALVVLFASSAIQSTQAVTPNAEEFVEARRWAAAKFDGIQTTAKPKGGLLVLANHDPVQLNNRNGRPMRLGDKEFAHGLYCHAVSKSGFRRRCAAARCGPRNAPLGQRRQRVGR
jgi:hypothetical protein